MIDAEATGLVAQRFGLETGAHGPTVPPERLLELARALKDELGFGYLCYITAAHFPAATTATRAPAEKHAHGKPSEAQHTSAPEAVAQPGTVAPSASPAAASPAGTQLSATQAGDAPHAAAQPDEVQPAAESVPARFVVVYRVRNLERNTEFPFRCDVSVETGVPSLASVWAGADWQEREAFDLVGPRFENHPDLRRIMLPEDWEGHPLQRQYAIDTPHAPWR